MTVIYRDITFNNLADTDVWVYKRCGGLDEIFKTCSMAIAYVIIKSARFGDAALTDPVFVYLIDSVTNTMPKRRLVSVMPMLVPHAYFCTIERNNCAFMDEIKLKVHPGFIQAVDQICVQYEARSQARLALNPCAIIQTPRSQILQNQIALISTPLFQ